MEDKEYQAIIEKFNSYDYLPKATNIQDFDKWPDEDYWDADFVLMFGCTKENALSIRPTFTIEELRSVGDSHRTIQQYMRDKWLSAINSKCLEK